jgi:hypothetical protein
MNTRTTPGLSFGLYRTDTSVLSFQAGLRSPGASFADSLGSFEVRRAASLDFRGLVGRNVVVAEMEGFVEAQAGYRFYAAGQPGEWRIDLTMGRGPKTCIPRATLFHRPSHSQITQ